MLPDEFSSPQAAGGVDHHIEHMIGLGAHGTGSSSATHPAAVFGPGGRPAGDAIVAERVTRGAVEHVYWRCEDQLNSCVGQIDENGWRTMQTSYLAFGEALQSRVLFDGALSRLSAVEHDGLALTTITLASNELADDELNGALLFLARPGYNGDRHMEAVVVDSTANTIVVEDLTGALEPVQWTGEKAERRLAARAESEAGSLLVTDTQGRPIADFVIFAFNDSKQANSPTYQTQGTWTSAPSYASSQTTFTDIDADDNGGGFASWMVGAILVPDVNIGAPLIITGATATTLTVAGDARGVASNGSRYIVYAAPFTDPAHGTNEMDPHNGGTRYLWAGYRYQPPQMGFWVDPPGAPGLGIYGAATGTNKLGQYYCWNRTYDIATGRWTTPDPVATPWWNLTDYGVFDPIQNHDCTGLETDAEIKAALNDPTGALTGKQCASEAEEAQKAEFPNQAGNQNEVDAYRHCVWQCCTTFMLALSELLTNCRGNKNKADKAADKGEERAKAFGDAHEEVGDDKDDKAAQADHEMDKHNNAIGRMIGKMKLKEKSGIPSGCPKEWLADDGTIDCRKSCRKALDNGDLRVLKLGKGDKVASKPFKSNGKGGPKASGGDGTDDSAGTLR